MPCRGSPVVSEEPLTESEEQWVLMGRGVFNKARKIGSIKLWNEALHATPDEMETDPNVHRHLNEGGIVVIHCSERMD